jgi:lipopolysaccharide/colanic/teichoic acid biosynthesis glycosyltransferase
MVFLINPFLNKGPLLFRQKRMGRWGRPFNVVKIRTMTPRNEVPRNPEAPLEEGRIMPFGKFLRMRRIDELPQIWNILRGEMSFIGPRPHMWEHACDYLKTIPLYNERLIVSPGISGYAQVRIGYAEGRKAIKAAVKLDLFYMRKASWRFDALIFIKTLKIILSGFGAK